MYVDIPLVGLRNTRISFHLKLLVQGWLLKGHMNEGPGRGYKGTQEEDHGRKVSGTNL